MIRWTDLPTPDDGEIPFRQNPHTQLQRLNRMASRLWEARELLGDDDRIAVSIAPDSGSTQITLHVHAPAERDTAEQLVGRLGWDPEADVRRHGITKQHYWHGMLAGYRAYVVWVELPPARDTQGRDPLPVGVGTGAAL